MEKFLRRSDKLSIKANNRKAQLLLLAMLTFLSILLALLVLSEKIQVNSKFTEFYILDEKKGTDFQSLHVEDDQPIHLFVGIINHESETAIYNVHLKDGDDSIMTLGPFPLNNEDKIEQKVDFYRPSGGSGKIDILLEKQGLPVPYRSLHILR